MIRESKSQIYGLLLLIYGALIEHIGQKSIALLLESIIGTSLALVKAENSQVYSSSMGWNP